MKSLFEGKKTSFSPEDLNMHSVRIRSYFSIEFFDCYPTNDFLVLAAELMETYQIAQKRCFFESEELVVKRRQKSIHFSH